mgnify:FL=1
MVSGIWHLGKRQLHLHRQPLVMGILNVTPDSFSDGGKHAAADIAIATALQMEADGADIIDIGGESTRPYSDSVGVSEEIDRVLAVIEGLANELTIPISIDTSKAKVATVAIEAGAEILNDVTGLEGDPEMINIAKDHDVGLCLMHMQGTPQNMQDNPTYNDVVQDILNYLMARRDYCLASGIDPRRICLDPGIGFGKTHEHNLLLLQHAARFKETNCPILIGHSRKGFIGKILGDKSADRMAGTLGVSLAMATAGADVLRVHDVKQTVDGLKLYVAAGGLQ